VNFVFKQLSVASLDGNLHFSENELKVSDTEGKRYWHPNAPPQHPFKNPEKQWLTKSTKTMQEQKPLQQPFKGRKRWYIVLAYFSHNTPGDRAREQCRIKVARGPTLKIHLNKRTTIRS